MIKCVVGLAPACARFVRSALPRTAACATRRRNSREGIWSAEPRAAGRAAGRAQIISKHHPYSDVLTRAGASQARLVHLVMFFGVVREVRETERIALTAEQAAIPRCENLRPRGRGRSSPKVSSARGIVASNAPHRTHEQNNCGRQRASSLGKLAKAFNGMYARRARLRTVPKSDPSHASPVRNTSAAVAAAGTSENLMRTSRGHRRQRGTIQRMRSLAVSLAARRGRRAGTSSRCATTW